ncbi:beta-lactamase/transpeptidase-like protein [Mortierella sp. GBAus27b]|nr:beta-lactamase/transpeptidase-like protein [Mortierella sp. GBAus27b]
MADKAPASAPAARPSFLPRLSLFQWFVRLLPAIIFGFITYSRRGPFQPPLCTSIGVSCPHVPLHLEGVFDRHEHYGQVMKYYISLFTKHEDLGGSLAVFVDGQRVIDVYAGAKDLEQTRAYDNQTLQQVYSSGKMLEGIVIARLVDQGLLDYEQKVAAYWPEFGQNGKENVRLVDLMTHESGVPHLDEENEPMAWSDLANEEKFSERLARLPHLFQGKPTRAYHAMSRGWFLNEIVRRVDPKGRSIGQIVEQDLMSAYPDVELYYSKLPKDTDWDDRLSEFHDYPSLRIIGRLLIPRFLQTNKYVGHPNLPPLHALVKKMIGDRSTLTAKTLAPNFSRWPREFRTKNAHAVEGTSYSLKTNAHSLAKLVSMMANRGASIRPGQEPDLMSAEAYAKATTFHSKGQCEVTGETTPLSVGGWVKTREFYGDGPLKGVEVQGWAGAGGSLAVWIEELNIGFAYVTNAFGPPETILGDYRSKILLDRVVYARKEELGLLQKTPKK